MDGYGFVTDAQLVASAAARIVALLKDGDFHEDELIESRTLIYSLAIAADARIERDRDRR